MRIAKQTLDKQSLMCVGLFDCHVARIRGTNTRKKNVIIENNRIYSYNWNFSLESI